MKDTYFLLPLSLILCIFGALIGFMGPQIHKHHVSLIQVQQDIDILYEKIKKS